MRKVLFIGLVFPEPSSSAAGTRMMQLIHLFQALDFEVVFASSASKSSFSIDLEVIGVVTQTITLNDSSFDVFVKNLNPDVVVFDRFISEEQFGWRVATFCPTALRILDSEDLHCLRYARHKAVQSNRTFNIHDLVQEPMAFREIASIYRCDFTLIISTFEHEVLTTVFNISEELLFYMPLFYKTKSLVATYEQREGFVFIGNFIHEPNYDAVLQLKHIWESIKKRLPEATLSIYGAYPSAKVTQLHHDKDGFLIKGRAENAFEVLENAKVLLAPLRFGAGIKGKLLEAMVVGTPSVTTTIGAEGIVETRWSGSVIDEFEGFANQAVMLYSEVQFWKESQLRGFEIIKKGFDKDDFEAVFNSFLMKRINELSLYRNRNFIGNLLYKNQFASVKFMSKWIEEKNK